MRSNTSLVAFGLVLALGATACGSGSTESSAPATTAKSAGSETTAATAAGTDTSAGTDSSAGTDTASSENQFPDIDVAVVGSGETVNLKQELAGGDTPVLLWFWAPH